MMPREVDHVVELFERIDRLRRRQGQALERAGFGARLTPSRIVFDTPGLRLHCYGAGNGQRPPLLIVPAPVKRWYIWDLAPGRSVVRQALARGFGVYLAEWSDPPAGHPARGLADYAGPLLDGCVKAIRHRNACVQVSLLAHSLGGILAALHSAWRPEHVAALALFDAPLDADGTAPPWRRMAATALLASLPPGQGRALPGSLLGALVAHAVPGACYGAPALDLLACAPFPGLLASHLRVRRWALDELPMARPLFEDVLRLLFVRNSFMRGELVLNGTRLDPGQVRAPLLTLFRPASALAPPDTVLGFHQAAGSAHKVLLPYLAEAGVALRHVAPLVGSGAHLLLWPIVFDWLERLAGAAPAVRGGARPRALAR
jgi:polyhydroxyalkanoate synthase